MKDNDKNQTENSNEKDVNKQQIDNLNEKDRSRRQFLKAGVGASFAAATGAVGLNFATPHIARAQNSKMKIAFSTPFGGQDSFSGFVGGIKAGVKEVDAEL